jgi:uncharacterized protein with HEPN domain
VHDALEHVRVLQENAEEIGLDRRVGLDAANTRLVAAIECLGKLPPDLRDQVCGADWPAVRSTRNRIVHGHVDIDDEVVRAVVRRELPGWERELNRLLEVVARETWVSGRPGGVARCSSAPGSRHPGSALAVGAHGPRPRCGCAAGRPVSPPILWIGPAGAPDRSHGPGSAGCE